MPYKQHPLAFSSRMLCHKDVKSPLSPVSGMNPPLTHLPLNLGDGE